MIKSFDYINSIDGTGEVVTPVSDFADILAVSRSGFLVRARESSMDSVTVDVLTYERILQKDGLLPTPGFYMYQQYEIVSGYRQQKFKVGATVPVGAIYSTSVYGVTAFYTAVGGDTATTVAHGLSIAINAATY